MRPVLAAAVALALLPCGTAAALGPGDFDRSFGVDGAAFTRIGPLVPAGQSVTAARDVETLPDGRILVAGSAPDEEGRRAVALARYRRDGELDRGFGDRGLVISQLGATESSASALALAEDGSIVITGTADDAKGANGVLFARFEPGGGLQFSVTDQVGVGAASASAGLDIALQADGHAVVVGRATTGGASPDPFVARFAGQTRDPSFGTGVVRDPVDRSEPGEGCSYGGAEASAILIDGLGRIVTGGTLERTCGERDERVGLLRAYTATGERDPAFATGSAGLGGIEALTAGPAETVLAGGILDGAPGVARYLPDGTPDGPPGDAFAVPDGFGAIPGFEKGSVAALLEQGSERVVAAVDAYVGHDVVVRLHADGRLDSGFSSRGLSGAGLTSARAVALQDDDVIVAGDRASFDQKETPAFVLTRLHGGTQASRVSVLARSRLRRGVAKVKLRCSPGPGCEGVVSGPKLGPTSYAMRGGTRDVAEVPVAKALRGRASIRVRVSNPPVRAVSRSISLR